MPAAIGTRIVSSMTSLFVQAKSVVMMLIQAALLIVQCVVAAFYVISALLMWGPFTYAPINTKIGWFLLVVTPFVSMFVVGFRSMPRGARTALIAALTFVQLSLMFILVIYG